MKYHISTPCKDFYNITQNDFFLPYTLMNAQGNKKGGS